MARITTSTTGDPTLSATLAKVTPATKALGAIGVS